MSEIPGRVAAVVFDCDGLLLETESRWTLVEESLFADHGLDFGPAEKDLLIGRSLADGCAAMARLLGRPGAGPDLEEELFARVEAELAAGVEPMPGAVELLGRLYGRIPLGIASNSPRGLLDAALGASGIGDCFDVSFAGDEVSAPKPDPELYLRSYAHFGAAPQQCIALEDSATGVAAARAAGSYLITVPSQPGKALDGDHLADSLADPAILQWAARVAPI